MNAYILIGAAVVLLAIEQGGDPDDMIWLRGCMLTYPVIFNITSLIMIMGFIGAWPILLLWAALDILNDTY